MDTEKTIVDTENREAGTESTNRTTATGSAVKKVAVGAGAGVLLGSLSSFMGASAMAAEIDGGDELVMPEGEEVIEPIEPVEESWSDGEIEVATSVTDEMSFGEAFAAARAEVGSGGAFEWRGNVYSTFTAEEWNSMSQEEIDEYNAHFSWGGSNVQDDGGEIDYLQGNEVIEDVQPDTTGMEDEVIEDAEIEILGVVHDDESGYDIGTMLVGDQEVYLVDVDPTYGGGEFDYMFSDVNSDGEISDNEIFDITEENVDVDMFADMSLNDVDGLA